ncbi:TadE/TadG family type IV pilus assembly protein [Ponticaulis profundi]|uniref:TadE/TadG family type IV pilus assembly protein n=1 Tax=Ponticaulis profundi TaxID=2665222 RepID=A0ABW1SB47_9PROT
MVAGFLSLVKSIAADTRGVSALEFALISPFVIGIALFAISSSFQILDRQKLDSAVTSTAYYLEDRVLSGDWESFQPVSTTAGKSESQVISTARLVLSDAFKSSSLLTIRELKVSCGCPQTSSVSSTTFDETKPFFTRYDVESAGEREICSAKCADSTEARILAEIEVYLTGKDLFGEAYVLEKKLVTRLR